jgi:hypothetical protein
MGRPYPAKRNNQREEGEVTKAGRPTEASHRCLEVGALEILIEVLGIRGCVPG